MVGTKAEAGAVLLCRPLTLLLYATWYLLTPASTSVCQRFPEPERAPPAPDHPLTNGSITAVASKPPNLGNRTALK